MKKAILHVASELRRAIWFYKFPLMVFFPVTLFVTENITVEETTLFVVLALAVLMQEIWLKVDE